MTIWVKELSGKLTIKHIQLWVKQDVNIQVFHTCEDLAVGDLIMLSKYDLANRSDFLPFIPIVYEDFMEIIFANINKEIEDNYNYYYLKEALEQGGKSFINTIITGSSYGLFGIDHSMLTDEVNLSLYSQDLYYSFKGILATYKANPQISTIVLCVSYYYFYSDLSQTQGSELKRVSDVYYPLFQDMHNAKLLPAKKSCLLKSDIFDMQKIVNFFAHEEYKKGFFNVSRPREHYATKVWKDTTKNWSQLTEQEKRNAGKERALMHNRQLEWKLSYIENAQTFQQMVSFCSSKKINLLLVVTPVSKYYREFSDNRFKEDFYEVLNRVDGMVHLLDLYEDESYSGNDFNDTDHLNDSGAQKMTYSILNLIKGEL